MFILIHVNLPAGAKFSRFWRSITSLPSTFKIFRPWKKSSTKKSEENFLFRSNMQWIHLGWVVMACLGPKPIKVLLRIKFQDGIDKPQKCRSVCFHPTHQQQKRPSTLPSSRMPASSNLSGAMLAVKVQTSPIVLPAKLTSKFATVATMTWPNTWRPTPISRNTPPFLQHQHYHLCLAVLPASTK